MDLLLDTLTNLVPLISCLILSFSTLLLGQCAASMVAAQKFKEANGLLIPTIYGSVSSGTQWRFLKLEGEKLTLDLNDYAVPPVEVILGMLVWMVQAG